MLVYRQRKDIFLKRYWSASSSRQLSRLTQALTKFHAIFFTIIEGRCINPAYTFLSNFIIKYRQNPIAPHILLLYQQGVILKIEMV
jgi:hypothetical protein